jgi:hypothetical protein
MSTHHCMHCDCANFKDMPCCFCLRIKGTEGKLTEHAKREVKFLKTDDWFADGLVQMIRAFESMGHPLAVRMTLPLLTDLLNGDILAPLTDNPTEWEQIDNGQWRSLRSPDAFSDNGGKTYFLTSESLENPETDTKFHVSAKSGAPNTQMTLDKPYLDTQAIDMAAVEQIKAKDPNMSLFEAVEKSQDDISGD